MLSENSRSRAPIRSPHSPNAPVAMLIQRAYSVQDFQVVGGPSWIGTEVTGRAEYYNSSLVARPFRSWAAGANESGVTKGPG